MSNLKKSYSLRKGNTNNKNKNKNKKNNKKNDENDDKNILL